MSTEAHLTYCVSLGSYYTRNGRKPNSGLIRGSLFFSYKFWRNVWRPGLMQLLDNVTKVQAASTFQTWVAYAFILMVSGWLLHLRASCPCSRHEQGKESSTLSPREAFYFYVEGLSSPGIHTSLSISKCVTGLSLSSTKGAWIENRNKLLAGISVPLNKVRVLLIKIWSRA